uniref:Uncharacterized protein n=1 Tax=Klebsiella pneumoniae TaxID=573 RepID=A0A8B0SSS9_KLEPN|nr:hypothetical protein [Klebsiella pneumoniae]
MGFTFEHGRFRCQFFYQKHRIHAPVQVFSVSAEGCRCRHQIKKRRVR